MSTIEILGEPMVLVPVKVVEQALDALTRMAVVSGGAFTCMEAETIADLFIAAGIDPGAFIQYHAEGDDDPDDLHYIDRENGENA